MLPNHTGQPTSKALFGLPKAEETKLVVLKVDTTDWKDSSDAAKALEDQRIVRIDVVIDNAGVSYTSSPAFRTLS